MQCVFKVVRFEGPQAKALGRLLKTCTTLESKMFPTMFKGDTFFILFKGTRKYRKRQMIHHRLREEVGKRE